MSTSTQRHNEVTPADGGWRVLFASGAQWPAAAEFFRSMKTRLYAIVTCGLLLVVLAVAGCDGRRSFPQTQALADGTKIRMEAAWVFDGKTPLLRVKFAYVDADPNERYLLHAALRDKPEAEDSTSPYVWQFGVSRKPGTPAKETPMCWEFRDFPRSPEKIYLRMRFQDKTNAAASEKLEFVIPPVNKLEVRDASIP
jgi:hypothetical protein